MLRDAWKSLFGRSEVQPVLTGPPPVPAAPLQKTPLAPEPFVRQSLGLEQFSSTVQIREGMRILDLSGASQSNINFMLQFGHHLYCEDLMKTMANVFGRGGGGGLLDRQGDDDLIEQFLSETFANLQGNFDGALVWDTLQFLQPPLLDHVVGHLHRLMEPGAVLFAFFPSDERMRSALLNGYRIESNKSMRVIPRSRQALPLVHTSRSLERLFSDFSSVKFFLTRDHYRELLVRR
jgi:hypothetical protein